MLGNSELPIILANNALIHEIRDQIMPHKQYGQGHNVRSSVTEPHCSTARFYHFFALTLSLFFTACAANPYAQYYHDATYGYSAERIAAIRPLQGTPQLVRVPSITKGVIDFWNQRGIQLGFSEFTSAGSVSTASILSQAKKIGAQYAIYTDLYSHSEQGVRPIMNYKPGTTMTTNSIGNASAWSSWGNNVNATYQGTSTTTTPGELQTFYVPATFQHRKYTVFFYAARR